jgi:phosphotriesterase-related protein
MQQGTHTPLRRGLAVACAAALLLPAASAESLVGKVLTINGPVEPAALGVTLPHEHLFIHLLPARDTPEAWAEIGDEAPTTEAQRAFYEAPLTMNIIGPVLMGQLNRDNLLLTDEANALKEATDYKWAGGGTIVDVTTIGLKPDPAALRRVAAATGLHIIRGTGWYEYGYVGDALEKRTAASLAEEMVRDITVGVDGNRAGIIGEVGLRHPKRAYEQKLIAAAVRASRQTGAPISIHFAKGHREQAAALAELKAAGADMSRVAMGHSNPIAHDMALMKKVLDSGAYLQFDLLGDAPHILSEVPDHDVGLAIIELIKQGYLKQILLSQDVCTKTDLKAFGGSGYSFILEQYTPYLLRLGVTQEQIDAMTITNPQRLLTFTEPRPLRS